MAKRNISNNTSYITESDLLILELLLKEDKPLLKTEITKKVGTFKHVGDRLDHLNTYRLIVQQEMECCKKGCKNEINKLKLNEINTIINTFRKKS